jgi:predicted NACHT family NTPase
VSVRTAVRGCGQLLVLGDPGSGKTTLLRYLAFRHATAQVKGSGAADGELGRPRFPIYARLGDFARSADRAGGIGAFLTGYVKGQECSAPGLADLLERKLAGGECLVLLDGLDEVASAVDRQVEAVTRLVDAVSRQGNRFIVTSRISGYLAAPLPASFDAIRLRDMDDQAIARFLHGYCPAVERAEAPEKSGEAVRRDAESAVRALTEALGQSPGVRATDFRT